MNLTGEFSAKGLCQNAITLKSCYTCIWHFLQKKCWLFIIPRGEWEHSSEDKILKKRYLFWQLRPLTLLTLLAIFDNFNWFLYRNILLFICAYLSYYTWHWLWSKRHHWSYLDVKLTFKASEIPKQLIPNLPAMKWESPFKINNLNSIWVWKPSCTSPYTILISQKIWADLREQVTLWKDFGAYLTQEIHSMVPNSPKKLWRYRMTREKLVINKAVFPSLRPRCLMSSQAKDTETTYLWVFKRTWLSCLENQHRTLEIQVQTSQDKKNLFLMS